MPTTRRPALAPGNCSVLWDGANVPAWGTASRAAFWIALEQPGPWGVKAFTASRLDPQVGSRLEKGAAAAGGRALLIRSSKEGVVDSANGYLRQVFVAGGMETGTPWLLAGRHPDAAVVAALPFEAIAAGDVNAVRDAAPWLWPTYEPVALVCTNSKRDQCCALRGRPIVGELESVIPDQVWECTHTGGHRFAPTAVLLPHGVTLARIPDGAAVQAALTGLSGRSLPSDPAAAARARAAGQPPSVHGFTRATLPAELRSASHLRGLAHLPPAHQAADGFIRERFDVPEVLALTVRTDPVAEPAPEREHHLIVEHRDGRTWRLRVTEQDSDTRPVSCGAAPVNATAYLVTQRTVQQ